MDSCKLCREKFDQCDSQSALNLLYRVKCPRCGVYQITDQALSTEPEPFVKERLHLISAVARWHSERAQRLSVNRELLEDRSEFEAKILSICPRNTQEKMDGILTYIAESSPPGHATYINVITDYPLFYCQGPKELGLYVEHLAERKFVSRGGAGNSWQFVLLPEGWRRVEEQAKPNIESKQAFVAMWFDDEMTSAYSEGIAKLEEDTGFSMLRIDMSEFNDKICDKILAEIRRSRFLIADVTGHRQGVYFEAGFAMGLGLPVIWTCRKDEMATQRNFDTRQYNHIVWTNPTELREGLRDRILATIGEASG